MKKIPYLLLTLLLQSCFSTIMDDDYQSIDPDLRPHLEAFLVEARARGHEFDISNLKLNLGHVDGAQGRTFPGIHQIMIDPSSIGWKRNPECLVFHELGHLYLNRAHRNEEINRRPLSIMSAADDPAFEDKLRYRREYYINELFEPDTKPAEWFFVLM